MRTIRKIVYRILLPFLWLYDLAEVLVICRVKKRPLSIWCFLYLGNRKLGE